MNVRLRPRWSSLVITGVGLLCTVVSVSAQEPLPKAKALYDAAAYEEALALLAPVDAPEAQQYKALCLLALGRSQDAAGAVESLVSNSPTFEPSANDVPPRFVTLVSDAKRKLLPSIARRAFAEGREQFKSGSREDALHKFDLVLTLASSPSFKDSSDAEDLRTLASGFIELAKAATEPKPEPVPPPVVQPARIVEAPPATTKPEVIQPVAIRQAIPAIPSGLSGSGTQSASVRVEIGADGKVTGASIQQPSHPLYDRMLLQAARDWVYTPASLNGRAIPSEKVITVQLR